MLDRAIDSLVLSIEHFNRPDDRGRSEAVLILLDHAFELLLKSSIVLKGGRIRKKDEKQTMGFDECVRKTIQLKIISDEQALTLQTINGLRDAAQHYILEISEELLYLQSQAGVTLFRDILKNIFQVDIAKTLPQRVLPLSVIPPTNISTIFDSEVGEIRKLLIPGRRRKIEAIAKLRALSIVDSSIRGEKYQPGQNDLQKLARQIRQESKWENIFPGVSAVNITSDGTGYALSLRITKKEGIPVHLVPEGTPGANVVSIKRVNELDYYNLSMSKLAENIGLTNPRALSIIKFLKLHENSEYFKLITIGKVKFNRYSQKAIVKIKEEMPKIDIDDVWKRFGAMRRKKHVE